MSRFECLCHKEHRLAAVCARCWLAVGVLWIVLCLDGTELMGQDRIQRLQLTAFGFAEAVIVKGDTCWTGQVQPSGVQGGGAAEQTEACVRELRRILEARDVALAAVARVHLYGESEEILATARQVLQSHWSPESRPALTQVITSIPGPGLVTLDVIAAAPGVVAGAGAGAGESQVTSEWARLPAGRQIHVAGQAEQSESVYEASLATLQSLEKTLVFSGRSAADIVQLKAFVQPASAAGEVQRAVQQFFGPERALPPLVIVEWKSGAKVPVEIELVAAGGPVQPDQPAIAWVTPPGMTKSPVYSRVCVVQAESLILTSGMTAAEQRLEQSAEAVAGESSAVLEQLRRVVTAAGSDFQHLVKATYYVSSDAASLSLNTVRPAYYDPERPPAASKAFVSGTGVAAAELAMDLIAVPAGERVR